jgi:hypothetical protein
VAALLGAVCSVAAGAGIAAAFGAGRLAGGIGAVVLACWLGERVFWTAGARRVARGARTAAVGAAGGDAVQHGALYLGVHRAAQAAAVTKVALLSYAVPVAAVAFAVTAARVARRPAADPISPEQVFPPPPAAPPAPAVVRQPPTAYWDARRRLPPGREPGQVGVCVSGGGLRAAGFGLGALQALRAAGELARADYLVSVGGGGYVAGALQLALQPERADGEPPNSDPNAADPDDVLAPGTPEEDYVRRHARYLTGTVRDGVVALGVLLRGLLVSLALLGLGVVALGLLLAQVWAAVLPAGVWTALAALAIVAGVAHRSSRTSVAAVAAGGLVALLGLGVPGAVRLSRAVIGRLALADLAGAALAVVLVTCVAAVAGIAWRRAARPGVLSAAVAGLAVAGVALAGLVLLGWVVGAGRGWPAWAAPFTYVLAGAAVLCLDQTGGLHPFYRRRLAGAFAVRRATGRRGPVAAAPYDPDRERTTLSRYAARPAGRRFPTVIVAAAADVSGPAGRNAVPFTFAHDWIGGPDVGWVATDALEGAVGEKLRRDVTVQAAVAISAGEFGGALGRHGRAYRALLALANARLGCWLPNPGFVCQRLERRAQQWSVPRLPRMRGLGYHLREIAGLYPADDRLLHCTDGGRYDSLGLVELLRHGCRLVYCVDASPDPGPSRELGRAIALARAELGVEIVLPDAPAEPGVLAGEIRYPDQPGAPSGTLLVIRPAVDRQVPYPVLCHAADHPTFPHAAAGDVWFGDGEFDAYQMLGRHLAERAAAVGGGAVRVGNGRSSARSYRA